MNETLLTLPNDAGRKIVESGALFTLPLLSTSSFVSFCKDRGLAITHERLLLLERLGRFAPVFRLKTPNEDAPAFRLPVRPDNNWFEKGWAWDTSLPAKDYAIPELTDRGSEGYYSIFQIEDLVWVLNRVTMTVQLDWYLEDSGHPVDWNARGEEWLRFARHTSKESPANHFRRAIGFLCQFISERYFPYTQGDQRMIRTGRSSYSDAWITAYDDSEWYDYVRSWKPETAANIFGLTPKKLRHAYETLAVAQEAVDPLANWYQLVQFVAVDRRDRLKGDALLAETLRSGALMLRMLHRDLYKEELPIPNEVTGQIFTHIPEIEVRQDTRRFLEFVANRFRVNPQPVLALFVEGPTEQRAIELIFQNYVGVHPGKYGIEIIVLGGVDVATGTKEDRFRAIFRLIDYLHHHQTLTFLLLDNEGFARRLQHEAHDAKSIHHTRRNVTRPDHIKLWQRSFEFDNYSSAEIADALTSQAGGKSIFTSEDVKACEGHAAPGAALKKLFLNRVGKKLDKMELAEALVKTMFAPASPRKIANRPIVKVLDQITRLAARNPLPTMQETWELNQASEFLGKLRGPPKKRKRSLSWGTGRARPSGKAL